MLGCNLPEMDDFTLKLVTNDDVLEINRASVGNRELFSEDGIIAWYASDEDMASHYVAVFNTTDEDIVSYSFRLDRIGVLNCSGVRDLWNGESLKPSDGVLPFPIRAHGVKLIEIKMTE